MTAPGELVETLLDQALQARSAFFEARLLCAGKPGGSRQPGASDAFRLFNGFYEGFPDLMVDLYAETLVLTNHAREHENLRPALEAALRFYQQALPWLQAAVVKTRTAPREQERRGRLVWGEKPSRKICEHGVYYAVNLMLNLDASFYLDTRALRAWALTHLKEKRVLNTFSYTGSLGTAASAGGARQVMQVDLNRRYLNMAKDSYALNGLPVDRSDFLTGDFWAQVNEFKRAGELFDCVFVDPPFFSSTGRGKVDLVSESHRVINKVRPLVGHNGWLVTINNAIFLSGADYLAMLKDLCADGFLTIEEFLPVPPDCIGFENTRVSGPPVDPAPFNHSTKIAVLRVTRKDQKSA